MPWCPVLICRICACVAAKQEAFEESIRLKNQFRALDEDEVDFLESVLESSRAKEDAVKRETADQLEAFRKQRAVAEQALSESPTPGVTGKADTTAGKGSWGMQKKRRRRDRDDEAAGGLKVRKLSSSAEDETGTTEATKPPTMGAAKSPEKRETTVPTASKTDSTDDGPKTGTAVLGLIGYESDSDD